MPRLDQLNLIEQEVGLFEQQVTKEVIHCQTVLLRPELIKVQIRHLLKNNPMIKEMLSRCPVAVAEKAKQLEMRLREEKGVLQEIDDYQRQFEKLQDEYDDKAREVEKEAAALQRNAGHCGQDVRALLDNCRQHLKPAVNWLMEAYEKRERRIQCAKEEAVRARDENRDVRPRSAPLMSDPDSFVDNVR